MNSRGVEYVTLGGYAVAFHGYPRLTGDIDFLIRANTQNAERVVDALKEFGFPGSDELKSALGEPLKVIQLGRPPNRIDLLTSASGINYDEAFADSVLAELDGLGVRFVGLQTLLKNKRASGRAKDLADAEELEKVAARRR
jgi:hypothetical protein